MRYLVFRRRPPVTPTTAGHTLASRERDTDTDTDTDTDEEALQSSHPLLTLQQQEGNRAVSRLLDPQREGQIPVTTPDNHAERAADEVASQVTAPEAVDATSASADDQVASQVTAPETVDATSASADDQVAFAGTAPEAVERVVDSEGAPLDNGTREELETAFGTDLADVRVHTGARAAESTDDVNARAYTVGNHIVFDNGAYDRTAGAHDETLAHELAHVVQQSPASTEQERPVLQRTPDATAETDDAELPDASDRQLAALGRDTATQSVHAEVTALEAELAAVTARTAIRDESLDEARDLGTRAETLAAEADEYATHTSQLHQQYEAALDSSDETDDLEALPVTHPVRDVDPAERARTAADRAGDAVRTLEREMEPLDGEALADIEVVEETARADGESVGEPVDAGDSSPVATATADLTRRARTFARRLTRLERRLLDDDRDPQRLDQQTDQLGDVRQSVQQINTKVRELDANEA
jgi:hypothetical protein